MTRPAGGGGTGPIDTAYVDIVARLGQLERTLGPDLRRHLDRANTDVRRTAEEMRRDFDRTAREIDRSMERTATQTATRLQRLSTSAGSVLRGTAVAAAGLVSLSGIQNFAKASQETFSTITKESLSLQRVMGGNIESVSAWRAAAATAGVSSDQLTVAFKSLSAKIVGNSEVWTKLGIDAHNADGTLKPLGDLLPQIAQHFKDMPNGIEKTTLAVQLFGRSGTVMLPFLNKGSAGLDDLRVKAKELGFVISGEQVAAFKKSAAATKEYKESVEGLKATVGAQLLPVMTQLTENTAKNMLPALKAIVPTIVPVITSLGNLATSGFGLVIPLIQVVAPLVATFAGWMAKLPAPILAAASAMLLFTRIRSTALFTGLAAGLSGMVGAFRANAIGVGGFANALGNLRARLGTGLLAAGKGLVNFLGGPFGIALIAATIGLSLFFAAQQKAAEETAKHKAAVSGLVDALKESKGRIDENFRSQFSANLANSDAAKLAKELGISMESVAEAAFNGGKSLADMKTHLMGIVEAGTLTINTENGVETHLDAHAKAAQALLTILNREGTTVKEAQAAYAVYTSTLAGVSASSGTAGAATEALAEQQKKAKEQADAQKKAIDDLKGALDLLGGGLPALMAAQNNYTGAVAAADAAIKNNEHTLDAHTAAGQANNAVLAQIQSTTGNLAKENVNMNGTAESTIAIIQHGKAEWIKHAIELGKDAKEAQNLADKLFAIPKELHVVTDLPKYLSTVGELDTIFNKVKNIPPKKEVYVKGLTTEAEKLLTHLGLHVEHMPDGTVKITGNTAAAVAALDNYIKVSSSKSVKIPIVAYVQSGSGAGIYVNGKKVGLAGGGPWGYQGLLSGPGTGTSDSIPFPWLSNGEYIMPKSRTDQYLPLLESMRAGTFGYKDGGRYKDGKQKDGYATGGVYGPPWPFLKSEWDQGSLQGSLDSLLKKIKITAPEAARNAFTGSYAGGGNLELWLRRAIAITGVGIDWLGPLISLAMHESGGNPNAINLWDRNALAGDPSRGLLQTIMSTFQAYRLPSLPNNIYDPVSNAVAAIRYMLRVYGSIYNIASYTPSGFVGGYEKGTPYVRSDQLAFLHRGEAVIPANENNGSYGNVIVQSGAIQIVINGNADRQTVAIMQRVVNDALTDLTKKIRTRGIR